MPSYWIAIVAREYIEARVKEGTLQIGYGEKGQTDTLKRGDWVACYSPKTSHPDGEPCQRLTAIGEVTSAEPFEVEEGDHTVWRHRVDWRVSAKVPPIRGLLEELSITRDKGESWGTAFRGSKRQCPPEDFAIIAEAMGIADPT